MPWRVKASTAARRAVAGVAAATEAGDRGVQVALGIVLPQGAQVEAGVSVEGASRPPLPGRGMYLVAEATLDLDLVPRTGRAVAASLPTVSMVRRAVHQRGFVHVVAASLLTVWTPLVDLHIHQQTPCTYSARMHRLTVQSSWFAHCFM